MPRKKIEEIIEPVTAPEETNEELIDVAVEADIMDIPDDIEKTIETLSEEEATNLPDALPDEPPSEPESDTALAVPPQESTPLIETAPKPTRARKKTIYDLNLNDLDRNLSEEERREWSAVYASYRSKSVMRGTVIGSDQTTFDVRNRVTNKEEKKTLTSLIIIDYRVKILIPESEMWMPGEERPEHVLRNMTGSQIDYVIMEIDREGQCAIGSRRMALAAKRHYFATAKGGHRKGELISCRVLTAGAKRITVECGGYDISLSQRELSYSAIADLRTEYYPGQELACMLKEYDREASSLVISVKEVKPNPFIGADMRHPVGCRRQAVISGKYAGGVFCTLPDDTVCLCLYSSQHSDLDFGIGDKVIIVIREYNYSRELIFGRILAKWR